MDTAREANERFRMRAELGVGDYFIDLHISPELGCYLIRVSSSPFTPPVYMVESAELEKALNSVEAPVVWGEEHIAKILAAMAARHASEHKVMPLIAMGAKSGLVEVYKMENF